MSEDKRGLGAETKKGFEEETKRFLEKRQKDFGKEKKEIIVETWEAREMRQIRDGSWD